MAWPAPAGPTKVQATAISEGMATEAAQPASMAPYEYDLLVIGGKKTPESIRQSLIELHRVPMVDDDVIFAAYAVLGV